MTGEGKLTKRKTLQMLKGDCKHSVTVTQPAEKKKEKQKVTEAGLFSTYPT